MVLESAANAPAAPHFSGTNPIRAILPLVGETPLLEIKLAIRGRPRRIFAKYESLNMTGSIKDRMAVYILGCGYEGGHIAPGFEIVEATSGNTGISFSAIGRALGHPVRIFMPDWMSPERVQILKGFGTTVVPISHAEGGFLGSIERADAYAASRDRVFLPHQFSNYCNVEAHLYGTGPEILRQLETRRLAPDAFVAGVGTGGTVMGVGQVLKARAARVHPLEPANSPVLSTGRKIGSHRIQGISDEFVPRIVDLSKLDHIVSVADGDAILMAQKLSRDLGLGVGISSGANLLGALEILDELGGDAVVATVLPDSNKKYLSTDLFRSEPVRQSYRSPQIELLGYCAIA